MERFDIYFNDVNGTYRLFGDDWFLFLIYYFKILI